MNPYIFFYKNYYSKNRDNITLKFNCSLKKIQTVWSHLRAGINRHRCKTNTSNYILRQIIGSECESALQLLNYRNDGSLDNSSIEGETIFLIDCVLKNNILIK